MRLKKKMAAFGLIMACFMFGGCEEIFGEKKQSESSTPAEGELISEQVADEAAWKAAFDAWKNNFTVEHSMEQQIDSSEGKGREKAVEFWEVKDKEIEFEFTLEAFGNEEKIFEKEKQYYTEKEGIVYKYEDEWEIWEIDDEEYTWKDLLELELINFDVFDFEDFTYDKAKGCYVFTAEAEFEEGESGNVQVWILNGKVAKAYGELEVRNNEDEGDWYYHEIMTEKYTYTFGDAEPKLPTFVKPSDPGNPSDPVEPSEPVDPSDPVDPSNPVDPSEPQGEISERLANQAEWEAAFEDIWENFTLENKMLDDWGEDCTVIQVRGKEVFETYTSVSGSTTYTSEEYYTEKDGVLYRYDDYYDTWWRGWQTWDEMMSRCIIDEAFVPYMYLDFQYDETEKVYISYANFLSEQCIISKLWIKDGKVSKITMADDTAEMIYTFGNADPQLPTFVTDPNDSYPIEPIEPEEPVEPLPLMPLKQVDIVGERVNSEAEWLAAFDVSWDNFTYEYIYKRLDRNWKDESEDYGILDQKTFLEIKGKEISALYSETFNNTLLWEGYQYYIEKGGIVYIGEDAWSWSESEIDDWTELVEDAVPPFSAEMLPYMYLDFRYDEQQKAYVAYEYCVGSYSYLICRVWIVNGKLAGFSVETAAKSALDVGDGGESHVWIMGNANPQLPEFISRKDQIVSSEMWGEAFEKAKTESTEYYNGSMDMTMTRYENLVQIEQGNYWGDEYTQTIYDLSTGKYYVLEKTQGIFGEWACYEDSTVQELKAEIDSYFNLSTIFVGEGYFENAIYDEEAGAYFFEVWDVSSGEVVQYEVSFYRGNLEVIAIIPESGVPEVWYEIYYYSDVSITLPEV